MTRGESRQVGDERARYGRRSWGERLGDVLAWPAAHRVATVLIIAFLAVGAWFFASRAGGLRAADLAIGDCLFVRTAAAQDEVRPIGEPAVVSDTLLAGGVERAGCNASHGHEVSAIVVPALPSAAPGDIGTLLDRGEIQSLTAPLCDAAFEAFVGRPMAGSRFTTFPVAPDAEGAAAWVAGGRRTVCLVARSDGAWMDHPARGSGE